MFDGGDTHRVCQAPMFGRCLHKRPSALLVDSVLIIVYHSHAITSHVDENRNKMVKMVHKTIRTKRKEIIPDPSSPTPPPPCPHRARSL